MAKKKSKKNVPSQSSEEKKQQSDSELLQLQLKNAELEFENTYSEKTNDFFAEQDKRKQRSLQIFGFILAAISIIFTVAGFYGYDYFKEQVKSVQQSKDKIIALEKSIDTMLGEEGLAKLHEFDTKLSELEILKKNIDEEITQSRLFLKKMKSNQASIYKETVSYAQKNTTPISKNHSKFTEEPVKNYKSLDYVIRTPFKNWPDNVGYFMIKSSTSRFEFRDNPHKVRDFTLMIQEKLRQHNINIVCATPSINSYGHFLFRIYYQSNESDEDEKKLYDYVKSLGFTIGAYDSNIDKEKHSDNSVLCF